MQRAGKDDERQKRVSEGQKEPVEIELLRPKGGKAEELRHRAEQKAKSRTVKLRKKTDDNVSRIVHDLEVHQIELEMQNEELRWTQRELEESRKRYLDLYDLAPVGYFTLDKNGVIVEVNLTGYEQLGIERAYLIKKPFRLFVSPDCQDCFYLHRKKVFDTETKQSCEITLVRKDGSKFNALLESMKVTEAAGDKSLFRTTVIDITWRKRAEEDLQVNETRFRELFNNMSSGVAVYEAVDDGTDFVFKDFNKAAEKIEKINKSDVIGRRMTEVFPGVREFGLVEILQRVWKTGKAERHPVTFYKDSRISGWRENYVYRIPSGEIVAIYDDVTEREQAVQALRDSEVKFHTAFHTSPNLMAITTLQEGRFIEVNEAYCRVTGFTREECIGHTALELNLWVNKKKREEIIQKVEAEGCVNSVEVALRTKSGEMRALIFSGGIITLNNETYLLSVAMDITDRKLVEENLQNERNLLRTLIDHIPDAVFVKDRQGRFILCNKTLEERWKEEGKGDIIGKTDFDLFEHKRAKQFFDEEQEVMRTGRPLVNSEGQFVEKSGKVVYGLTTKVPLHDGSGNVIGIVGVNRNITEKKLAGDKLLEYQKQLKQLASQLALAEEKERRRIAGELHDQVGQALALAKIKLDSLCASATSRPADEVMAEVSETLQHLTDETRSLTFDLSYPILYEIGFEAAVSEWLDEQVQKKHDIAAEFIDDGRPKELDEDMRVLLFRNVRELLINCIKHSNANKVKVGIRRIDNSIEVTVEDNGVGFDPTELGIMTTHKGGFGLFSIRENLEELGGRFEIESKPGTGCKVTMTAPFKGLTGKSDKGG